MNEVNEITKAIGALENAERTAPDAARTQLRGVVEELVYLRLRLSMGDMK